MVERRQMNKDKEKAQREKKIRRVDSNKENKRFQRDLRDLTKGNMSSEEFDEEYGGGQTQ